MRNLLQEKEVRWKKILLELDEVGYLTTDQIRRLFRLGGKRNAQRILKELSPYLCQVKLPENAHFLSKKGKEWIGSSSRWRYTRNIHHYLVRNEVIIQRRVKEKYFETTLKLSKQDSLVPDAFYFYNQNWYFLEVDRTQKMVVNKEKIDFYRRYRDSGRFPKKYGLFPIVQFVTTSRYRQKELIKALDGMRHEVLLETDLW